MKNIPASSSIETTPIVLEKVTLFVLSHSDELPKMARRDWVTLP
jgi:hypothetical protein